MKRLTLIVAAFGLILGTQLGPLAGQAKDRAKKKQQEPRKVRVKKFLDDYQAEYAALERKATIASWNAANSGKEADFDLYAKEAVALRQLHADPARYKRIQRFLKGKHRIDPMDARVLEIAELEFKANQLSPEMLKRLVEASTQIEKALNTYRAELDGKRLTNNDLLEQIAKETDTAKRQAMWEALKQVGGQVGPKIVALAKLRNEAAAELGYANYWEMKIRLQDYEPEVLLAIFKELEEVTDEPFTRMKAELDGELSRRFKIEPAAMMPWHYDNPFFQDAPPAEKVDLDEFYEHLEKEEIVELAVKFFRDIGLPIEKIVAQSDLYEREGKDQHAFCTSIDRAGDVRTLLNIKPTVNWMEVMLHEQGHAVYDVGIERSLPFSLREPSHIFATEGVAMLFGALSKNPTWMVGYAGADPKRVKEVEATILQQRRREQLIFARWTMVMLHFEKALYEDPDQDLNRLWWDYVERFQKLKRPSGRDEPDWAAKPHFTIAPVYYHNYMLGELFAAQMRHTLADMAGHKGPTVMLSFNGRKEFGTFLRERVFQPGKSKPWREFVDDVTGEDLSVKHFAEEVR